MKKHIILPLALSLILGLSACGADSPAELSPQPPLQEDLMAPYSNDALLFAELYPVSEDNPFIFASFEDVISLLDIGTGILAFGFPECPRCQNAFPILEKAFYEMNLDGRAGFRGRILYYNIFDDREENNERYQALVGRLEEYLRADADGNPRIYVPDVFFLASGKIVGNHMDTVAGVTDPQDSLSDLQAEELLSIYKGLIARMEDSCC